MKSSSLQQHGTEREQSSCLGSGNSGSVICRSASGPGGRALALSRRGCLERPAAWRAMRPSRVPDRKRCLGRSRTGHERREIRSVKQRHRPRRSEVARPGRDPAFALERDRWADRGQAGHRGIRIRVDPTPAWARCAPPILEGRASSLAANTIGQVTLCLRRRRIMAPALTGCRAICPTISAAAQVPCDPGSSTIVPAARHDWRSPSGVDAREFV